jgi:hypothetical protein
MGRDKPEPAALLQELSLVEFVLEAVDVGNEERFVFLTPLVVNLHAFVLIKDEGLIEQPYLVVAVGVCYPFPDPVLVVVVTDGLYEFGLEFGLAHRVLVL